jgi:transposase
MPGPLSTDLRERVVAARRSGLSRLVTAQLFSVSESSVQRWCRLDREQGNVAPKPMGGTRPFVLANEHDWLVERIAEQPDVALRTLLAELHERAIEVSYFVVWNIVDRTGLSYKKTLHASEQDRPDVARRRLQWQQRQASVDPRRLIFIDET